MATSPTTHDAPGDALATGVDKPIWLIFAGLMLAMLLAALDQTIVATALPVIVGDLGGLDHLSWVVTAYLLGVTVTAPIYGKLGDQFGRKSVFMVAIAVFLVGSLLSGTSRTMTQLIAWRAVQGVGGGGLMVLAQAIIADVVSPRERARYQGYFGAVFGTASVAGPLLGGFFTDNLSWRYVFYINLPLGIAALVVAAYAIPSVRTQVDRTLDYAGFVLMAGAITCLVLVTTWGGTEYAWGSPTILGLGVATIVLTGAFVVTEARAREPVLPLRLFRDRTFDVASGIGFVIGFGMFGVISFLPLFLQTVNGASATGSGLALVPFMAGMLTASIASGQVIARTGRYRPFPIAGTAVAAVGMYLLSTMSPATSRLDVSTFMVVVGLGLGMVMQVIVLAVQSSVAARDMGAATANVNFFRSVGGSVGVAVFGALFNANLAAELTARLPADAAGELAAAGRNGAAAIQQLPQAAQQAYVDSMAEALTSVFLWAVPVVAVGVVVAWLLPAIELRGTGVAEELARDAAAAAPIGRAPTLAATTSERPGRQSAGVAVDRPTTGEGDAVDVNLRP